MKLYISSCVSVSGNVSDWDVKVQGFTVRLQCSAVYHSCHFFIHKQAVCPPFKHPSVAQILSHIGFPMLRHGHLDVYSLCSPTHTRTHPQSGSIVSQHECESCKELVTGSVSSSGAWVVSKEMMVWAVNVRSLMPGRKQWRLINLLSRSMSQKMWHTSPLWCHSETCSKNSKQKLLSCCCYVRSLALAFDLKVFLEISG